ncbi:GNAT family N-acetyltransferase (plasmid) [Niallia taxi]|uniref:GNAT family N-acetyltransferase n=1 Tax=Niallia TaxID=2837506 RepID=UPI0015F4BD75|nr:GNAT family N-acetyltransferase [Niallia taxi]MED4057186.1 GNAT family N-acetyltransferase [Niallia taxi]MED4122126.1 GNAT family N-acetyltransferase [Niallia taxi]
MFDFLLEIDNLRNKRSFTEGNTKDLESTLKSELLKLENDPEKLVLNELSQNEEYLIVYRTTLDPDDQYSSFYIELRVINTKGILRDRVRLSAMYKNKDTIEICDIEIFGENQGRGYGSVLLSTLIKFAIENFIKQISGWISYADEEHFEKLDYFYKKNGFLVRWNENNNNVHKAAEILWKTK